MQSGGWCLLNAGRQLGLVTDEQIENCQHMTPVLHHAIKHLSQAWLPLCFPVPAFQHLGRHLDVAAEVCS